MGSRRLSPRNGCERHLFRRTAWQFLLAQCDVSGRDQARQPGSREPTQRQPDRITWPIDAVSRSGRLQTIEPWQAGPIETMPPSSAHMLLSSFTTPVRFGSSEQGQQSRATGRMRRRTGFRCRDRKSLGHDYIRANFPVCGIHVHESDDRLPAGLRHAGRGRHPGEPVCRCLEEGGTRIWSTRSAVIARKKCANQAWRFIRTYDLLLTLTIACPPR
jgi:hypothetical protein